MYAIMRSLEKFCLKKEKVLQKPHKHWNTGEAEGWLLGLLIAVTLLL